MRLSSRAGLVLVCLSLLAGFLAGCNGENKPGNRPNPPVNNGNNLPDTSAGTVNQPGDPLEGIVDSPDRKNWQKPDLVLEKLGTLSGKTIADIGSGHGYFTFLLAEQAKKVIAIDIDQRFLDKIDQRLASEGSSVGLDIETRLTPPDRPNLETNEVDVVFLVNTYHFIENRTDYFSKVLNGLSRGGRLLVVDFKIKKLPIGPNQEDKVSPGQVVDELVRAGFRNFEVDLESLEYQYIVIAQ